MSFLVGPSQSVIFLILSLGVISYKLRKMQSIRNLILIARARLTNDRGSSSSLVRHESVRLPLGAHPRELMSPRQQYFELVQREILMRANYPSIFSHRGGSLYEMLAGHGYVPSLHDRPAQALTRGAARGTGRGLGDVVRLESDQQPILINVTNTALRTVAVQRPIIMNAHNIMAHDFLWIMLPPLVLGCSFFILTRPTIPLSQEIWNYLFDSMDTIVSPPDAQPLTPRGVQGIAGDTGDQSATLHVNEFDRFNRIAIIFGILFISVSVLIVGVSRQR
jgi:hypothetical protein